jgi:hypothetical protein
MARDLLQRPSVLQELVDGQSKLRADDFDRIDGIDLHTRNVTAALSLGLLLGPLGEACIRQILHPERGGPLGERSDEGQ